MMNKKSEYSEKLRDPRWQKLRLQVFERDGWKCRNCGDSETTLAVHHKRYQRGLEPWEYPLESLMTLCEECHQGEYEERRQVEQYLLDTLKDKGFLSYDVWNLMAGFADLDGSFHPGVVAKALSSALHHPEEIQRLIDHYGKSASRAKDDSIPTGG